MEANRLIAALRYPTRPTIDSPHQFGKRVINAMLKAVLERLHVDVAALSPIYKIDILRRIVQHEVWSFGFSLISHPGNSN